MEMPNFSKKDYLELKKMMSEWEYLLTEEEYKNEIIENIVDYVYDNVDNNINKYMIDI